MGHQLRQGDVVTIAIHNPDHAQAVQVLRTLGWHAVGTEFRRTMNTCDREEVVAGSTLGCS
jgi:hypothetical protein